MGPIEPTAADLMSLMADGVSSVESEPVPVSPASCASSADSTVSPASGCRNPSESRKKEWTEEEDAFICSTVPLLGCRWRRIAELLPGRSDDAVRNRWARLNGTLAMRPAGGRSFSNRSESRTGWSKEEDSIIVTSVDKHGPRWVQVAERLPHRTEHAIRNRWHRIRANNELMAQVKQMCSVEAREAALMNLLNPAVPAH